VLVSTTRAIVKVEVRRDVVARGVRHPQDLCTKFVTCASTLWVDTSIQRELESKLSSPRQVLTVRWDLAMIRLALSLAPDKPR